MQRMQRFTRGTEEDPTYRGPYAMQRETTRTEVQMGHRETDVMQRSTYHTEGDVTYRGSCAVQREMLRTEVETGCRGRNRTFTVQHIRRPNHRTENTEVHR